MTEDFSRALGYWDNGIPVCAGIVDFLVPTLPRGNAYNKPRRVNSLRIGRPVMDSRLRGNDGGVFCGNPFLVPTLLRGNAYTNHDGSIH